MSRVLVVATSKFGRGGIAAVIKAQKNGEQWKRFHCYWLGYHIDRAIWIKVLYYGMAIIRYFMLLPFYQIVHFQFSLPTDAKRAYFFFKIAKFYHKKTIIHLHCGDQLPEIWNTMYKKLFTCCDLALVLSPSIKKKVEGYIGNGHRLEVLYNPCPSIMEITPFSEREKEILFAGTLNHNKGYSVLLKGFAQIASKHPDWKIIFAGNGEVEQAEALARELHVEQQCVFLGWVSGEKKDRIFRRASILCLASYQEGFPMAVLDAWAYGVPVVCTPAGGLIDIIDEGKNGLFFDAGNVDILSEKLDKIISDNILREQIANESRILASTTFNISNLNRQLGDFYSLLQ